MYIKFNLILVEISCFSSFKIFPFNLILIKHIILLFYLLLQKKSNLFFKEILFKKMNPFEFDCAIVCINVPKSIVNGLSLNQHEPVVVEKAALQHKKYLNVLENIGLETIELEPDENFPDCVFVEVFN
jgi:hypothetical protein